MTELSRAQVVTLSFPCSTCNTQLHFGAPWDLLQTIDLECARCHAVYLIPITCVKKGEYNDTPRI